jgi:hypothetical protein
MDEPHSASGIVMSYIEGPWQRRIRAFFALPVNRNLFAFRFDFCWLSY